MSIDRFPVSSLIHRYNIGRTTLYERINALNLQPQKEGNRAFFSPEQVALLDALNQHIEGGGNTPEFVRAVRSEQSTMQLSAPSTPNIHPEQVEQQSEQLLLLQAIATHLITASPPPPPPDPLRLHRQLEEIAMRGWIVTTAQLKSVLGYAPTPGERYGFSFTKVGRQGAAMGWQIQKIPLLSGR